MRGNGEEGAGLGRRAFLKFMGASAALAGLDGCTALPAEHILPYVDSRPELTPGVAQYYATAMCIDGYAMGLIVESHEGRPTKVEGNPRHPASLGATGPMHQASVLQLYDPDRARVCRIGTTTSSWSALSARLSPAALRQRVGARGERLRLLIEPSSSPLDEELLAHVLTAYPAARVHMYAPMAPAPSTRVVPHYDLSAADVIVAFDNDFLASGPFSVRYARQFAAKRRLDAPTDSMNRLYVVETGVTPTGTAADHRFAARPSEIAPLLHALLSRLTGSTAGGPDWLLAVAADLQANHGKAVVIGPRMPNDVEQSLVDAINTAIGAMGATTWYAPSPLIGQTVPVASLPDLCSAIRDNAVDTLIVVGGNPSYAAPHALDFSALLRTVPNAGYLGHYENETARDVRWFVPASHYLESWGDARAYDGTLSIVQPLIKPLYDTVAAVELYAVLSGATGSTQSYDLLRASWARRATGGGPSGDAAWSDMLQQGVVPGTAITARSAAATSVAVATPQAPAQNGTVDVNFATCHKVHDGRFANNAWLQELPAPITELSWGNAALVSPRTAQRLGVGTGDPVTLSVNKQHLALPAYVVPGHADDAVTVHLGYGRTGGETIARDVGANAYALWPALGARFISGQIARGGNAPAFALSQQHSNMSVGAPVHQATLEEYRRSPRDLGDKPTRELSLYPPAIPPGGKWAPNQWAMTIDLTTCIGCASCVVACQAENNIPVVGPDDVRNSRAMHWIRIERYFAEQENDAVLLQPMLCQHCENAPCEYVCPVEATVHSSDGLNEMVYNRCVGTRFCSNNCPYKVRHFNWFDYNAHIAETVAMAKNPNVTVRERGVMEKCTFCVQRIREAEIAAGREDRVLEGHEVKTACQQACPTNAIVFGSLTEPGSEMSQRRTQPRAYSALAELGTQPRVKYLARIRNPNPSLPDGRE